MVVRCAKDVAAFAGLALGLAAHQHLDPALEHGDFVGLGGDDAAEIVGDALKMGDFLFQMVHGGGCDRRAAHGQGGDGAPCPFAVHPLEPCRKQQRQGRHPMAKQKKAPRPKAMTPKGFRDYFGP